jgi:uncharacterized protein YggT (Ycf19 family)
MFETSMIIQRLIGSAMTLYMMALCLRWLGAYIEVDMDAPRLRPITRLCDPHIRLMRDLLKKIGPLGPMDWAPIAALMSVWY